jgi:hypothetical protein
VLEHIPQPLGFLRTALAANGGGGAIYIEVPCLDWILRKRAWFDVFYEHVNYFRLSDFDRMFGKVHESGHQFGGQYLYAVADLASLRDPAGAGAPSPASIPDDFFSGIDRSLRGTSAGAQRVIWGGAAKGVMFSHHALARGLSLEFAIDINPAKQGKYLAGTGMPVLSPAQGLPGLRPGADIFVMNSNYLEEIRALAGPAFRYIPVDLA